MSDSVTQISRLDFVANERLYLDSTRTKVLKEGDKEAAFLLAAKGQIIPTKEVERLGLNKPKPKKAELDKSELDNSDAEKSEPTKIGPTKITTASPEEIKNRATR